MMRKKIKKNKGPVRSKKVTYDGITFASGLEKYMYSALKEANIRSEYEGCTFVLQEGFEFKNESTPDFISHDFIIETKGRANESFPMRWKMFKRYVNHKMSHVTLYKPQNQKECDKVIEIILEKRKKL